MVNKLQATIDTYDQIASRFSKINHEVSFWQSEFTLLHSYIPVGKVLEIGCGAGRDSLLFTKNKYDYLGFDASAGMLKQAKKRNPKARFIRSSFFEYSYPKETYDAFWAAASLLHVPKNQIKKVLDKLFGTLKFGGVGIIIMKEKLDLDQGNITDTKYGKPITRFFAFYTKDEFKEYLEKSGFKVITITSKIDPDHPSTHWLSYVVTKPYSSDKNLKLVLPSIKYRKSYVAALREFEKTDKKKFAIPPKQLDAEFTQFVTRLKNYRNGKQLPKGIVPYTQYWLVKGDHFIGGVSVRHKLSPALRKFAGHIGYSVRPTERRKGYGTLLLKLGLQKAKELGIKKALVTCNVTNGPSRKIIESNGGAFFEEEEGQNKFWINT